MKAELTVQYENIRIQVGEANDPDNFYSFELYDSGRIIGGPFCKVTETTIAAVRERLLALLGPAKMC